MPRVIWKGAITFGLVHVPVALYPASQEIGIDFDWLDKRSMDPVGYKRVNKRTGKEIQADDIVKGIKQGDGDYVILSEDQIKAAYPKSTQTIEIEFFVKASEIPFTLLETPYYLEPVGKGEKVYALLRESMLEAGVIGIARVVMHTKEHLAALIPSGAALVLNTIRWAGEIRPLEELKLPAEGKTAAGLKPGELKMAAQLIGDMTGPWKSDDYSDKFSDAILALVSKKVEAGETATVTPLEDAPAEAGANNVVDLTDLLAKSLAKRKVGSSAEDGTRSMAVTAKKSAPKTPTRRRV
ncbi:Ku protein [Aromatoleum diolicum]|uniref:Non-homologous end joining protein Ku n=1 Tax=Aromatoleum diolicum TaxID=75796 RepID=A0ABX1QFG3_9RHOO|nr:Ku protein [Aromatoleum diolicum]NMG76250.1 Ku protein [Aromatoleum diolicum]